MRYFLAILALCLVLARPAAAQTVEGVLVERGTSRPIASAVVVLQDSAGARLGAVLTDPAGRFRLAAPSPGRFRLRAERVGFQAVLSPPLDLSAGERRVHRMEADAPVVTLEGIRVSAGRRCTPRPGSGPETAAVWEEVRKGLSATALAQEQALLRYDLVVYSRQLEPETGRVVEDQRREIAGQARTPFESVPADVLSRQGFAVEEGGGVLYRAPDAGVLLSDEFLADHCFSIAEDAARPGMVGLAFEPVRGRTVPDVAGVLWLDRATARLRTLEYRYVQLPTELSWDGAGGKVEFERLPTGRWIVRRWAIRMPQWRHAYNISDSGRMVRSRQRGSLVAVRENGGEVVASSVREAEEAPLGAGRVAGLVWDSVAGEPLAGARVTLAGTSWSAVADEEGWFDISGVAEGRYTATFAHPALAAWGAEPPTADVTVGRNGAKPFILALPDVPTLAARVCREDGGEGGVVMGVVDRVGRPEPAAGVRFTWREIRQEEQEIAEPYVAATADEHGFYAVCGLPLGKEIMVSVEAAGLTHTRRLLLEEPFIRFDLHLPPPGS